MKMKTLSWQTKMLEMAKLNFMPFFIESELIYTLMMLQDYFTTAQFRSVYCELMGHHPKTAERKLRWLVKNLVVTKQQTNGYYTNNFRQYIIQNNFENNYGEIENILK